MLSATIPNAADLSEAILYKYFLDVFNGMSVYARPHPGPRTEIPIPNRDRGEGAHRYVAGPFLNRHCCHRFGVIGCGTHDNPAHRLAQNAANDSSSPGGEGRGEGGCHPCIPDVMAAPAESCFTPCHALKTSKNLHKFTRVVEGSTGRCFTGAVCSAQAAGFFDPTRSGCPGGGF